MVLICENVGTTPVVRKEGQKQEQNVRGNNGQEVVEKICGSRKYCKEIETTIPFKKD